jgi:hypothetical protein
MMKVLFQSALLSAIVMALPEPLAGRPQGRYIARNAPLNSLTSPYTLSVYVPWNPSFNGAKANDFNVFEVTVASYCPLTGDQASLCPNGTQQAFVGTFTPASQLIVWRSVHTD